MLMETVNQKSGKLLNNLDNHSEKRGEEIEIGILRFMRRKKKQREK